MLFNTSEAAGTLTVGVDAFRNERKRTSSRPRVITGIIVVGSAAINDTEVDFYIEDYYLGRFRNSRAGVVAPIIPDDLQAVGARLVPAGSQVAAIIVDAPVTSPLLIQVHGQEM